MGNVASPKSLSKSLSRQLDELGFDPSRIWQRTHLMKKLSDAKDISTKHILKRDDIEKVFVGSQRDGTGLNHCNDLDVLQINHSVLCRNDGHLANIENDKVIFQTVQNNTPHGYVRLKLLKEGKGDNFHQLEYALVERNGEKYLSSEIFMTKNEDVCQNSAGWIGINTKYKSREGPSIPKYTKQTTTESWILRCLNLEAKDTDVVRAFPCEANPIIEGWSKRERKSGWPSQQTVAHVTSLPALVVPVGQKGSLDKGLQWRVCFTEAEIHLVQNFNNVQKKIYVLMKLIAKYYLRPVSNDVSSYVVKNAMLWLSEEIPESEFQEKHLVARLKDAIEYLKNAVENKDLPNYMIPERNLFEGKLMDCEKDHIMDKLNFLLENGETVVAKYVNEPDQLPEEVGQVLSTLRRAMEIETVEMKKLAFSTKEQLAEKYIQMFSCQSQENMIRLNIQFNAVPFLNIYGREWSSNPLNSVQNWLHRKLLKHENLENSFKQCMCDPENIWKTDIRQRNDTENEEIWRLRYPFCYIKHLC